ncbi:sugar phosphate isomerase/epimerase family protein [Actinomyces faecalis]|uniref:sugar phosphate isomerase/epimerase family protein n=1 Tax=Actinomyces faecalis TaxID=2722820 RepID=UPI00155563B6|nr:sugar phosphate isomerase/epimerase family protein [Actinomyces faecalis]
MRVGIGTYALFWEWNERCPHPLGIEAMIDWAKELGCDVFQICDDPRIEDYDDQGLDAVADRARSLDVELELGTRGTGLEHLSAYVRRAQRLGVRLLRSMVQATEVAGGLEPVVDRLRRLVPVLEAADVTLALETYEQVPTDDLVRVVRAVDSERVGICLDPANCVSALETPDSVMAKTSGLVTNLHVKDFAFTRNEGWVGFLYAGARLGEGLLDLDAEIQAVYGDSGAGGSDPDRPSAVVEHWVPWQGDIETTIALERSWTETAVRRLLDLRAAAR